MNTFTIERNNYRRKLIMLVKQHPILWNKTQENYNRNRPQKTLAWHQISEQLDITVDKLRRTWENLRDQYRRDLKREVRFGFKSKWRFFSDMDFIRTMVSCKENEYKENEFSDSDSELDVIDNPNIHTQNFNTTQPSTTNISATRTTCGSTKVMNAMNSACPINMVPFQPIVLSKQWQPLAQDLPPLQYYDAPSTSSYCPAKLPKSIDVVDLAANCDSSKDSTPPTSDGLRYENVAKQEPDNELEFESAIETVQQLKAVPTEENETAINFQESYVSTSSNKGPCRYSEEISDTTLPTTIRSATEIETDVNVKDDDYHFVMSLLPSLRQIPRRDKFPLRINIMSIIAQELKKVCKE